MFVGDVLVGLCGEYCVDGWRVVVFDWVVNDCIFVCYCCFVKVVFSFLLCVNLKCEVIINILVFLCILLLKLLKGDVVCMMVMVCLFSVGLLLGDMILVLMMWLW